MKLREAIEEVDTLKPNMYGMQEKIKWLSRLDKRIFQEILLTHELSAEEAARFLPENQAEPAADDSTAAWALDLHRRYPEYAQELIFNGYGEGDVDGELLVQEPYDEMYRHWLAAQVDWNNMEYESFNMNNALFESVYTSFRNAFNRTHKPRGSGKVYY